MTTKISASNLSDSLITTITAGGGPKITAIEVTDNAWTVLDDTAVDLAGGYIKITGTGFQSGCQVLINNTPATATTFVSSTQVRAQVPAAGAGTYVVYLANSDGGVAIAVNGITYSANPAWTTASTLNTQIVDVPISIQLSATDATTYALAAGSSLPAGVTLTGGGLLSGTVTGITEDTTYSFTVVATDAENQDSPRTFSVTVTAILVDQYFNSTVLLLSGDGANGAQNNTFVDSSTAGRTITRYNNATQGSFSPFSPTGWSNYFDGTGDYLTIASDTAIDVSTGDFTIEAWVYPITRTNTVDSVFGYGTFSMMLYQNGSNWALEVGNGSSNYFILSSNSINFHSWTHLAVTRNGNNFNLWINGNSVATNSTASPVATSSKTLYVGLNYSGSTQAFTGNISNFRVVKGTALYTSSFTPSATPLTAVSGTSLLTCQSNRFKDNSTNNFAITANGNTSVQAFSPFAPAETYDTATHGGSVYLDGTDDYLTVPYDANLKLDTDFTVEFWTYMLSGDGGGYNSVSFYQMGEHDFRIDGSSSGTSVGLMMNQNQTVLTATGLSLLNRWAHIAITRSGSTYSIFVDGALKTTTASGYSQSAGGNALAIGMNTASVGAVFDYKGYMGGLRHVRGTAIYTADFTPPTAPLTAVSGTQLLLNYNNAGIYDTTAKNVLETVGNAQVGTGVKKYGTGSIAFDGTVDHLIIPDSSLLKYGFGDFTIEFWINVPGAQTSGNSWVAVIAKRSVGSADGTWAIDFAANTTDLRYRLLNVTGGTVSVTIGTLTTNQWYHVAISKENGTTRTYLNGVASGTTTSNVVALDGSTEPIRIGWDNTGSTGLNGYIDDLRITRGVARYTSNFTPPDKALPIQ